MPGFRMLTIVARPPEAVFAVLADPRSAVRTQPGTTSSEIVSRPPMQAGSRLRRTRTVEGHTVEGDVDVALFRPGKEIEFVGQAREIRVCYRYQLKAEGAGTKITLDVSIDASGLAALFAGVVSSALQRADAQHLERIREIAESSPA